MPHTLQSDEIVRSVIANDERATLLTRCPALNLCHLAEKAETLPPRNLSSTLLSYPSRTLMRVCILAT